MKHRIFVALFTLLFSAPAFADCVDDVCGSIQKILLARSSNFAKLKGKPGAAPKDDPLWEGTQTIPGLINYCYVYARGEGSRYEHRCDASGLGAQASLPLEKAKKIADGLKTALQSAEPQLVWFDDPAALALADIEGFRGTEGWYGGYAKNKSMLVKVEIIVSEATGSVTSVTIFAKPLTRRDLK